MNGPWLGRGRGGRLAIYGGCTVILVFLMLLYRAATSEMTRLREINELCTNQQEALANQLQVIYEYKVRLEKFLADEKSSNAAVKQELQQRASHEKSLRDKDSVEAMQRFNSLQQTYKILQTEHQDLREEFKKFKAKTLEETEKKDANVSELTKQLKKAEEDKVKSMEHLKNKFLELKIDKERLNEKYNEIVAVNGNRDSTMLHLQKQVMQLQRELEDSKKTKDSIVQSPLSEPSEDKAGKLRSLETPVLEARPSQQQPQQQPPPPSANQQQQQSPSTAAAKVLPESQTKPSSSTASSAKIETVQRSTKSGPKLKLPLGVPPIPPIPKPENDDDKKKEEKSESKAPTPDKSKDSGGVKDEAKNAEVLVLGRKREKNAQEKRGEWLQEFGEEVNQRERHSDFDDRANQGNEQYDDNSYYKDPLQKNNDLQMQEEEGDEGEDEEDAQDYLNNLKSEKRN